MSSKSVQRATWAGLLFIVAVVASCEISRPIPGPAKWNINPELKYRANQQLKGG